MRYANSLATGRTGTRKRGRVGTGFSGPSGSKMGRSVAKAAKGRSGLATRRAKSSKMALGRKR